MQRRGVDILKKIKKSRRIPAFFRTFAAVKYPTTHLICTQCTKHKGGGRYLAPDLEILEVLSEHGFAATGDGSIPDLDYDNTWPEE